MYATGHNVVMLNTSRAMVIQPSGCEPRTIATQVMAYVTIIITICVGWTRVSRWRSSNHPVTPTVSAAPRLAHAQTTLFISRGYDSTMQSQIARGSQTTNG